MMDQAAQGAQPQQGGGEQGSPGELLSTLDQLLGVFAQMVTKAQVPDEIKQAAGQLQGQFRAIVEAASQGAQGGGGGQQRQQPQAQPVRSQGMPMGQY